MAEPILSAGQNGAEHVTTTEATAGEEHSGGLSIDPGVIGFQAFNFIVLILLLNWILYKPILKLLKDREKRMREGVENAEKADQMLTESNKIRQDMIKTANTESQEMLEKARKEGESVKNNIIGDAHKEADKIVQNGQTVVEMEKTKSAQELKAMAVSMVVAATEKVLRSKLDSEKDSKMIEESLKSYSA